MEVNNTAFLYEKGPSGWVDTSELLELNTQNFELFYGNTVSISGQFAVVSGLNSYIYRKENNVWSFSQMIGFNNGGYSYVKDNFVFLTYPFMQVDSNEDQGKVII